MRIAHLITRMILGGAQENTLFTCLDLVHRHGDEVLLVTGPAEGPEGSLLEQARAGGVPLELVPALRRSLHPWHDLQAYRALRRVLARFQPQVVHTHSAKAGFLGRYAAWAERVPVIVHTVHGAPYHPYQGRGARALFRWCEKKAARRCHKLVSVADAMTDMLVRDGVAPREKFVTVYSGMEVEPFLRAHEQRAAVRARLGYATGDVVIATIARLFHLKGHADIVRAAKSVCERCPEARFLFVGDGLLRGELERQIERAGLASRFRLVGLVPPGEIPAYLGASDLLVHASLREGLARALPQALLAGKPAVSYDIDGAREVVLEGETGFLVPPGQMETLAQRLVSLVRDERLRSTLGTAGRRRFTEQFRHETMSARLRELYAELLESPFRKW